METNYSKHAAVWDWDDFDNSENYDFWCKLSDKYGKRVLSAMGAIGQAGAYMAKKGYSVTVLDYTEEMIFEGEKRFGDISSLDFVQADICEFELPENHYDFCFIATADLHVLPSLETVKMALKNINKHLRLGVVLDLNYGILPKHQIILL